MAAILLGLIAAAAALAFAVVLLAAKRFYTAHLATTLDPVGLTRVAAPPERPPGTLVVFFGDSRAAQWPAPPDQPAGVAYLNYGINGQTSAQVLGRLDAHVRALAPDVLVLQVGSNDLKTIPLFPDRAREIEERCVQHIREIVTRSTDSGSIVILTTIFPHGPIPWHRRLIFDRRVTEATRRVNDEIRGLAGPRVIVVDTWSVLAGADGLVRREFCRDLLHLTPAGYDQLNAALVAAMDPWLRRLASPPAS